MQPPKNLIATLRDLRLHVDNCSHRITYRVYETMAGIEIAYRHMSRHSPPWPEPEEHISRTTRMTLPGSQEFVRLLAEVKRTPIPPIPSCGMMDAASVSLTVGCYQAAAKYSWNLGNPPRGWEILDRFAKVLFREIHGEEK